LTADLIYAFRVPLTDPLALNLLACGGGRHVVWCYLLIFDSKNVVMLCFNHSLLSAMTCRLMF